MNYTMSFLFSSQNGHDDLTKYQLKACYLLEQHSQAPFGVRFVLTTTEVEWPLFETREISSPMHDYGLDMRQIFCRMTLKKDGYLNGNWSSNENQGCLEACTKSIGKCQLGHDCVSLILTHFIFGKRSTKTKVDGVCARKCNRLTNDSRINSNAVG